MKKQFLIFTYARPILAFLVVIGCFCFLFFVSKSPIPEGNLSIVSQAQGFVLCVMGTVIGYYFGTSKDKSDQDQVARTPNTTTTQSTIQTTSPAPETVEELKHKVTDYLTTVEERTAALVRLQAMDPSFAGFTIDNLP